MANNVMTRLEFHHCNGRTIKRIKELVKGCDTAFDLEKIVPMPGVLEKTDSMPHNPPTAIEIEAVKETGHPTWYSWRRKMWGTSRNTYCINDMEPWDGNTITFCTANGACTPAVVRLSQLFPGVIIDMMYANEDMESGTGRLLMMKGVVAEFAKGTEADIYAELWGCSPL